VPERWDILTRICSAVTAAAVAGALVGLPAPAPVNKPSTEAFPCQHHACGCMDAEMCRTHCCCFKPKVKSCCSARKAAEQGDDERGDDDADSRGAGIQAASCAGVNYVVVAMSIPVVKDTWHVQSIGAELCGVISPLSLALPNSRDLPPALPPPRA